MNNKKFLIFSGHNDRAVFALCRFFESRDLPFSIIASNHQDKILTSPWLKNLLFIRKDNKVNIALFQEIRKYSEDSYYYCPTTEFINDFFLKNENHLKNHNFHSPLPASNTYYQLSNKKSSVETIDTLSKISPPKEITWGEMVIPCVFKPRENIHSSSVNYPRLCFNRTEVENAYENLDHQQWFAQEYVTGQSYYLCAYLSQAGEYSSFWQENLIQQPGGKSIVLAKSSRNPGVDERYFIQRLIDINYHGPLMMEVLKTKNDEIFFIEINPRFWGPLQLAVDFQPRLLDLFASDAGYTLDLNDHINSENSEEMWYAWAEGAKTPGCKYFPNSNQLTASETKKLLSYHDVFNVRRDQRA